MKLPYRKPEPFKPWEIIAEKRGWDKSLVAKVWKTAMDKGLNPMLALAVVAHESGFKTKATNRNKDGSLDWGLFQLNSRYHPQLKNDIDGHITYGVTFLKSLTDRYGLEKGLGAYNAGPGNTEVAAMKRKVYTKKVLPLMQALYRDVYGDVQKSEEVI